jgi:hypothetical protein
LHHLITRSILCSLSRCRNYFCTWRLFTTLRTPGDVQAILIACSRASRDLTVPLRKTFPSFDTTLMPVKSTFLSIRSRSNTDLDRASSSEVSAVGTSTVALLCSIWQPRADVRANKTLASRVLRLTIVSLLCHGHLWVDLVRHTILIRRRWERIGNRKYHLITRSALASTLGGITRPICLALQIITSSNFLSGIPMETAEFCLLRKTYYKPI